MLPDGTVERTFQLEVTERPEQSKVARYVDVLVPSVAREVELDSLVEGMVVDHVD